MSKDDKELDKEAERAFRNLTTTRIDQNSFDQEFDVSFDQSTLSTTTVIERTSNGSKATDVLPSHPSSPE